MTRREISNSDSYIDKREVQKRLDELQADIDSIQDEIDSLEEDRQQDQDDGESEKNQDQIASLTDSLTIAQEELEPIQKLWDQIEGFEDETLIREDEFTDYAEEMARDVCGLTSDQMNSWPLTSINWDDAADDLKQDYEEVDFDGITYLIRA